MQPTQQQKQARNTPEAERSAPVPLACVRNIKKSFAETNALAGVDLDIFPGELVALLGPNGAGKTTLINAMLGRIKLDSGSCMINGGDPQYFATRQQIGVMMQVASVPTTLTVKEHIDNFRAYYPAPFPLDEILSLCQLEAIAARKFGELSGGQKQRMLFALAICGNPKLVLLDEPSVGLDIKARKNLWKVISQLRTKGTSILLTTHYLEEAEYLADRVYVLANGKIIAAGATEEIKQRGRGRILRFRTTLDHSTLKRLAAVVEILDTDNNRAEILSADSDKTLRDLLAQDANVSDLTISDCSLEQAFTRIVSEHHDIVHNDIEQGDSNE